MGISLECLGNGGSSQLLNLDTGKGLIMGYESSKDHPMVDGHFKWLTVHVLMDGFGCHHL